MHILTTFITLEHTLRVTQNRMEYWMCRKRWIKTRHVIRPDTHSLEMSEVISFHSLFYAVVQVTSPVSDQSQDLFRSKHILWLVVLFKPPRGKIVWPLLVNMMTKKMNLYSRISQSRCWRYTLRFFNITLSPNNFNTLFQIQKFMIRVLFSSRLAVIQVKKCCGPYKHKH